jgi:hypothetical protein
MQRLSFEDAPWVYERRNATVQDSDVTLTIEMHHTLWSDEFEKYTCRDLCTGGKLYENPDLLTETSEYIKQRIRMGSFVVTPMPYTYFKERDSGLSGFIYIYDTEEGMRIGYKAGEYRERTKTRR